MVRRRRGKEEGETGSDLGSPLGAPCLAPCPAAAGSKDGLEAWLQRPPPPTLESRSLGGRKAGAGNAASQGSGEVTRLLLAQLLQLQLSGSPSKVFHLLQERWPGAGAPGEPPWSWNNEPFLFSLPNPPLPTPAFEGLWRPRLRTRLSPLGDTQEAFTKWHRAPCRAVGTGACSFIWSRQSVLAPLTSLFPLLDPESIPEKGRKCPNVPLSVRKKRKEQQ